MPFGLSAALRADLQVHVPFGLSAALLRGPHAGHFWNKKLLILKFCVLVSL